MNFLLIFTIICSFIVLNQAFFGEWSQCGSKGVSSKCYWPLSCVFISDSYSQCKFKQGNLIKNNCIARYVKCNGLQWTGGINCCSGLKCVYENVFLSSCQITNESTDGTKNNITNNNTNNNTNDNTNNNTNNNTNYSTNDNDTNNA